MAAGEMAEAQSEFCRVVDSMSSSIRAVQESVKTLLERFAPSFYSLIPPYLTSFQGDELESSTKKTEYHFFQPKTLS
jgi:hypothetical protein